MVNDKQKVYGKEIIGEIKKDANLILEEARKDISSEINGEVYFSTPDIKKFNGTLDEDNFISHKASLIWVLQGKIYSFPKINHFVTNVGSILTKNTILTFGSIRNNCSGIVNFDLKSENPSFNIRNFFFNSLQFIWFKRK